MFVEVIIPLALPKNYTWSVPPHLLDAVQPGVRVEVVLGRNKKYAGIVKRVLPSKPESFQPKDILNVLDPEPLLYTSQLQLWEWVADYYMCSEGEVMQAAIPANLKLSSESVLIWNEAAGYAPSDLSDAEYLVTEALELKKIAAERSATVAGCCCCLSCYQKTHREEYLLCVGRIEAEIQSQN